MPLKKLITYTLILLVIASCKKKAVETDNLFKFRDYISYTTSGVISVASPIQINLANPVEDWEMGQEITDNILSVKPHVEGKLTASNKLTLLFTPDENLEPNTEYTVTIKLNSIHKNLPKGYDHYTFQFKTIRPNFNVTTNSLQSYSKNWQYLEGVIKSADVIAFDDARTLIEASKNGNKLPLVFNE